MDQLDSLIYMTPTGTSTETWLPIPGYEGFYEVSDHGRIKSLPRRIAVGGGGSRLTPLRILKLTPNEKGYLSFVAAVPGQKHKRVRVHLAVITAFVGPRPEGLVARHLNGICTDNTPANLAWGTRKENWADAKRHRTSWQQQVTECKQGHPLAKPNLTGLFEKKGFRVCLACTRARNRIDYYGLSLDRLQEISDQCYSEILAGDPHLPSEDSCRRGHDFTPANTQLDKRGRRTCRACAVARYRIPTGQTPDQEAALQELADQVFALGGKLPPLAPKTHCKRRHRLVEPNLVPSALKRGLRSCLACHRALTSLNHTPGLKTEANIQKLADQKYQKSMTFSSEKDHRA